MICEQNSEPLTRVTGQQLSPSCSGLFASVTDEGNHLRSLKLVFPLHRVAARGPFPDERLSASPDRRPFSFGILAHKSHDWRCLLRDLSNTSIRQAHYSRLRTSEVAGEVFSFMSRTHCCGPGNMHDMIRYLADMPLEGRSLKSPARTYLSSCPCFVPRSTR